MSKKILCRAPPIAEETHDDMRKLEADRKRDHIINVITQKLASGCKIGSKSFNSLSLVRDESKANISISNLSEVQHRTISNSTSLAKPQCNKTLTSASTQQAQSLARNQPFQNSFSSAIQHPTFSQPSSVKPQCGSRISNSGTLLAKTQPMNEFSSPNIAQQPTFSQASTVKPLNTPVATNLPISNAFSANVAQQQTFSKPRCDTTPAPLASFGSSISSQAKQTYSSVSKSNAIQLSSSSDEIYEKQAVPISFEPLTRTSLSNLAKSTSVSNLQEKKPTCNASKTVDCESLFENLSLNISISLNNTPVQKSKLVCTNAATEPSLAKNASCTDTSRRAKPVPLSVPSFSPTPSFSSIKPAPENQSFTATTTIQPSERIVSSNSIKSAPFPPSTSLTAKQVCGAQTPQPQKIAIPVFHQIQQTKPQSVYTNFTQQQPTFSQVSAQKSVAPTQSLAVDKEYSAGQSGIVSLAHQSQAVLYSGSNQQLTFPAQPVQKPQAEIFLNDTASDCFSSNNFQSSNYALSAQNNPDFSFKPSGFGI
jgi:hypothetical protein